MTDYELAMVRLKAWKYIDGWGVAGDPKATDIIDKLIKTWSWEERMRRAYELAAWAMRREI
jgi:hypothetical protein